MAPAGTADTPAQDPLGAFRKKFEPPIRGRSSGPLSGLRFAAKDLFDVEGYVTGCGNPDWERTHPPATRTAPVIRTLLDAGATLVGKTHTDELAYSVNGENAHFGTPVNPRAANRIPGGSSSGSASAVAGGVVDFAIGTDTAASVRLPASYCGLYGIRPTHGRLSQEGLVPLAPGFDTVGWLADSPELLRDVGRVLLTPEAAGSASVTFLVAEPAFELCDRPVRAGLERAISRIAGHSPVEPVAWRRDLGAWSATLRILQAFEAWQTHGEWIREAQPSFGTAIEERFAWASTVTAKQYGSALSACRETRAYLDDILGEDRVLLWPTTPCIALPPRLDAEALEPIRQRILPLTCVATLGGLPQITMPVGQVEDCPIGLSLVAPRGRDFEALERVVELARLLAVKKP